MNKKELKFNEKSQSKTTSKNSSNLISNLQPLNSNFSSLTSNSRGITLIALVITIIVMLILVCVTVTVAINGGLFNTAKDASRETQFEKDKESLLSAVIGAVDSNAEVDFTELDGNLPEGFEGNKKDGYTSGSGNKFYVDKNGNITTEKPIEPLTVDDYGKYVEYSIDLNKNGILTDDWKVFYVDSDGSDDYPENNDKVFIIAADYVRGDSEGCPEVYKAVKASKMVESAANGFEDFCFGWDSSPSTYECYDGYRDELLNKNTKNKKQCSYPDIFMQTKYLCSSHAGENVKRGSSWSVRGGIPNSLCASTLLCSDNWKSLVKAEEGALYAIGGPTVEMWIASWNDKYGSTDSTDNGITLYANGYDNSEKKFGYDVGTTEDATEYSIDISSCSAGYFDELYFPHRKMYGLNLDNQITADDNCIAYWLASPARLEYDRLRIVGYDGILGSQYSYGRNVRTSSRCLS